MVTPLRHVLLKHVSAAFVSQNQINGSWRDLRYLSAPDFVQACRDYDVLIERLTEAGVSVHFLPEDDVTGLDSIYVHDPAITVDDGMILCRMGKPARSTEPEAVERFCRDQDIPVLGRIEPPGLLEAGDIIWLDADTLVVGEGYRSNQDGIRQLRQIVASKGIEVIALPLPHWNGPSDVLHLMSLISPVAPRCAVVYSRLLPVPFRQKLVADGFSLIEVPDPEFDTLGCNVLSLSPALCLMADGNPETRRHLEEKSIQVLTYPAAEISMKGQGGPTCLTRPLVRA